MELEIEELHDDTDSDIDIDKEMVETDTARVKVKEEDITTTTTTTRENRNAVGKGQSSSRPSFFPLSTLASPTSSSHSPVVSPTSPYHPNAFFSITSSTFTPKSYMSPTPSSSIQSSIRNKDENKKEPGKQPYQHFGLDPAIDSTSKGGIATEDKGEKTDLSFRGNNREKESNTRQREWKLEIQTQELTTSPSTNKQTDSVSSPVNFSRDLESESPLARLSTNTSKIKGTVYNSYKYIYFYNSLLV